jgi:tRNA U34 5-carboxymethylaminomethyl modifying enzyme MnmG/GidA
VSKSIANLFCGQFNGTSGYDEAVLRVVAVSSRMPQCDTVSAYSVAISSYLGLKVQEITTLALPSHTGFLLRGSPFD